MVGVEESQGQVSVSSFYGRRVASAVFLLIIFLFVGFRIKQEWDLALINVLTATFCNAFVVWSVAPCRSYGSTFRFDLQNTIQKLPNNIFEKSYPMREFDLQKRIHSFFYKAAELCLVGLTAGSIQGALSKFASSRKQGR